MLLAAAVPLFLLQNPMLAKRSDGNEVCYAYADRYDWGFVPFKELNKEYFKEKKLLILYGHVRGKSFVLKKRSGAPRTVVFPVNMESFSPYTDPVAGMGSAGDPKKALEESLSGAKNLAIDTGRRSYVSMSFPKEFPKPMIGIMSSASDGKINPPYESVYVLAKNGLKKVGYCSRIKGYPKTSFAVPLSGGYLDTEKLSFGVCDSMGKRNRSGNFVCLYYGNSILPDDYVKNATALIYPSGNPLDGYVYWNYMENQNPYLLGLFDKRRVSIDLCFERVGFSEIASLRPVEECGILSLQAESDEIKRTILDMKYGLFSKRIGDKGKKR